jgi:transcription initiation factor TFIID subunit 12
VATAPQLATPIQQQGNAAAGPSKVRLNLQLPSSSSNLFGLSQPPTPAATSGIPAPTSAFKEGTQPPTFTTITQAEFYPPVSQTINTTNPGPVQWAPTRPTLTGGIPSGRMSGLWESHPARALTKVFKNTGTPAQIARAPEDASMLSLDDNRSRRKNTAGDQSMRRTIQDLVASVDPNVKIEPEVEDVRFKTKNRLIQSLTSLYCSSSSRSRMNSSILSPILPVDLRSTEEVIR